MLRESDDISPDLRETDAAPRESGVATAPHIVGFNPPEITRRHLATWNGMHADTVQVVRHAPFEYSYRGSDHLLIASERADRYDGETLVEGLPKSTMRNFTGKLTFVPAGRRFHGWQKPRALTRVTYFYIDPRAPLLDPELRFAEADFEPLIFFFDRDLWDTAMSRRRWKAPRPAGGPIRKRSASCCCTSCCASKPAARRMSRPSMAGWRPGSRSASPITSRTISPTIFRWRHWPGLRN